jgi:preprotein translocase subunit SecA
MAADLLEEYRRNLKGDPASALKVLAEELKNKFGYILGDTESGAQNVEALERIIIGDLEGDLEEKERIIGPYLNAIIRDQYLHAIDRKWLDHLENMEALREAVYLRSYAQKNPLTEYKVEGFQIFDSMIGEIRQQIASRMHLIRIQTGDKREERPARSAVTVQAASHSSMGAFAGGTAPSGGSAPRSPQGAQGGVTVVRAQPKVGRNDPCPCGSGKKYKHCHGR